MLARALRVWAAYLVVLALCGSYQLEELASSRGARRARARVATNLGPAGSATETGEVTQRKPTDTQALLRVATLFGCVPSLALFSHYVAHCPSLRSQPCSLPSLSLSLFLSFSLAVSLSCVLHPCLSPSKQATPTPTPSATTGGRRENMNLASSYWLRSRWLRSGCTWTS